MRVVSKLLLSGAVLAMCAAVAHAGTSTHQRPIIDGAIAGSGDFYGTVGFVDFDGVSFCTGTLVAPTVIVSASHCFVEQDEVTDQITYIIPPEEVFVVAGEVYAEQTPEDLQYPVRKIVLHPSYPGSGGLEGDTGIARQEDIAVVLLTEAVTEVSAIPIPSVDQALETIDGIGQDEAAVTITGYGLTDPNGTAAGVLNIATTLLGEVGTYEFAVGAPGSPDSCKGDSGGPAYIQTGGVTALYGASSRAVENSNSVCGDGGLYTFVPAYRSWIAANSDGEYSEPSGPIGSGGGNNGGGNNGGGGNGVADDDGCAGGAPPAPWSGLALLMLMGLWVGRRRVA